MTSPRETTAGFLRIQAEWCSRLGSPLYAACLRRAADDVERGGPVWSVLEGHEQDPPASALALRLMGAVHRVVLEGGAPLLARRYPSAGGVVDPEATWDDFRATVAANRERLRLLVERPVQTNEVGRSAVLALGFLAIARDTRLPLRLLEIGAAAGLNLRFDQYRYESSVGAWGPPASPVRLLGAWVEGRPPLDARPEVLERRGSDASPLDPGSREDRRTLLSYVWADQLERIALLRNALEVAARLPAVVERSDAAEWLERQHLAREGAVTVVFHSIVWQYLSDDTRRRVREVIERAGDSVTSAAPLAWLRMEPGAQEAELRLRLWPPGREHLLATAGFHGRDVRWRSQ